MARQWQDIKLAPDLLERVRGEITKELESEQARNHRLLVTQRRRLQRLERTRQKLIDAYLAEALPVTDLKQRQEALTTEQREAERLITLASADHALAQDRLEVAVGLLEHCDHLYARCGDAERQQLNQAFFEALYLDVDGVEQAELNAPFATIHRRSRTYTRVSLEQPPGVTTEPNNQKNPGTLQYRGSDLSILAALLEQGSNSIPWWRLGRLL